MIATATLTRTTASSAQPTLSLREAEVLRLIAQGRTCRQVAYRMGVATHTVDTYLRRIKAKFGVTTKVELTRLAISLHL